MRKGGFRRVKAFSEGRGFLPAAPRALPSPSPLTLTLGRAGRLEEAIAGAPAPPAFSSGAGSGRARPGAVPALPTPGRRPKFLPPPEAARGGSRRSPPACPLSAPRPGAAAPHREGGSRPFPSLPLRGETPPRALQETAVRGESRPRRTRTPVSAAAERGVTGRRPGLPEGGGKKASAAPSRSLTGSVRSSRPRPAAASPPPLRPPRAARAGPFIERGGDVSAAERAASRGKGRRASEGIGGRRGRRGRPHPLERRRTEGVRMRGGAE